MSKSVKMIVGVVASIAIPFAAPALAAMVLASTAATGLAGAAVAGATALGATGTSALIGAGLGAATAAATGADVGKGALFGGLGGGIGGLAKGVQAANVAKAAQAAQGAGAAAPAAGMGIAPLAAAAPVGTGTVLAPQAAGVSSALSGSGAGLSGLGSPAGAPVGTNTVLQGYTPPAAAPMAGPATFDTGNYLAGINATPGLASTGATPPTFGQRFAAGIKAPFTPENLSSTALSGAKYVVGSLAAGSGMDPAQEQMLQQQRRELRRAQDMNQQTFATRTEAGLKSIREADYYDPEYMGLQRARQAQLRGARMKQAGLRGVAPGQAQAEGRRFDLGTSRETGTAYDQGYQGGIQARTGARAAGVAMLPSGYQATDYTGLMGAYGNAEEQRRNRARDVGNLFGDIWGSNTDRSTG